MFRATYRSSSGALTVFAASGLHTHMVTGRSQVLPCNVEVKYEWIHTSTPPYVFMACTGTTLTFILTLILLTWRIWWALNNASRWQMGLASLDYGWSPHAYVNQRLQIQLELLMMSGVPLETCWAFNERWNDKFCCKVTSCWLLLLRHL